MIKAIYRKKLHRVVKQRMMTYDAKDILSMRRKQCYSPDIEGINSNKQSNVYLHLFILIFLF
jgi:hypothetical protein